LLPDFVQSPIFATEIGAPAIDAMRLVDDEEGWATLLQGGALVFAPDEEASDRGGRVDARPRQLLSSLRQSPAGGDAREPTGACGQIEAQGAGRGLRADRAHGEGASRAAEPDQVGRR